MDRESDNVLPGHANNKVICEYGAMAEWRSAREHQSGQTENRSTAISSAKNRTCRQELINPRVCCEKTTFNRPSHCTVQYTI